MVATIHPSVGVVPRNFLRCYVEFSAPMNEGDAARRVQLVDASGDVIAGAPLEDVCGNSLLSVFDRDLGDADQDPITASVVTRVFRPA
jgi:hypothetical protein